LRRRGIPVSPRARSPIALLIRTGVLDARPLLILCVRVDAEDLRAIAGLRCAVAHCPASNAKLGHGVAPLLEMLAAGIDVGLGSDSVASNNHMDLLGEARLAALMQRARAGTHDGITAARALELATLGGARALGMSDAIGSLERGKQADLAAFSLADERGTPALDPVTALIFALPGRRARLTVVAGRELVRDGALVHADASLAARVQAACDALRDWRATRRRDQH
jgi:5-methylthioadenosine/S-adenosylhomocysteine deaminase